MSSILPSSFELGKLPRAAARYCRWSATVVLLLPVILICPLNDSAQTTRSPKLKPVTKLQIVCRAKTSGR